MKFIAILTGDYPDLGKSELFSIINLTDSKIIKYSGNFVIFETENIDEIKNRVTFVKYMALLDFEFDRDKSYKIIEVKFSERESKIDLLAKKLGGKVNLTNPEIKILSILTDKSDYSGLIVYERNISKYLEQFKHRPFNHPSSINPLLARAMINISSVKTHGTIIDPFAGTGTFLTEARRMQINAIGIDLSSKMVVGAKKNLDYYGIKDARIFQSDFRQITSYNFDAIVTDPPYGRGSKLFSENKFKLYQDLFNLIRRNEFKYSIAIPNVEIYELSKDYLDPILAGKIMVHKSLTRYIITNNKSIVNQLQEENR